MRFLFSRSARRHGNGDPFDAVDIRRYTSLLRSVGFADVGHVVSGCMTGIVTAAKPD
jgi:demethylmenaquinone methyltransferase/2-methoxy-6-polyprenyl-1,4-benzoquinol methylase